MIPYLLMRTMEEADSDDSRASVITVESNASDDVIISGQENPSNDTDEQDVIVVQHPTEPPGSEPQATTSGGHSSSGADSAVGIVSEEPSQDVRLVTIRHEHLVTVGPVGMVVSEEPSETIRHGSGVIIRPRDSHADTDGLVTEESQADEATNAATTTASPAGNVSGSSSSLDLNVGDRPSTESEGNERSLQSSAITAQPASGDVASTPPSLLPAIQEFIAGTTELTRQDCLTAESLADRWSDSTIMGILKSLHKSLSSITSVADAQKLCTSPSIQRKRKQSEEDGCHNAKKLKLETEKSEKDAEENSCSICLEPWSTGGEHRITSLKCGHLFGLSCITKWVDQDKSCPQCKAKAKKSEFRGLFVKNIMAEDTSQRDRALLLLELEKEKVRDQERCEATLRRKVETQSQDLELIRLELARCKSQLANETDMRLSVAGSSSQASHPMEGCSRTAGVTGSSSSPGSSQPSSLKKFHTFQRIYISQEGQCRVFDFSRDLGMTVVSQKSSNPLFRGYGIKMLARDFRPLSYQPLHSAAIRDMSFRPGTMDGMLLTCGLDKTVLLSSVTSRAVIQKYTLNSTVWCCAWNTHDTNVFYAGMERGLVREFDIRRTNAHVRDVLDSGGSPISNIQFWRGSDAQGNFFQGLLIAQLQNLVFKQQVRNNFTNYVLPQMKAPVMSLCLHTSGKFLSSFRPGLNVPKCRYEVSDIRMTDEEQQKVVTSRLHAMFDGGGMQAVISRNCLLTRPETENGLLAVTANHSNNTTLRIAPNKMEVT
ncbi:E3 ubiquitin-protein ligase RFWD3-like [Elysia marginata]|uniref:RING-type E3 ubiquitin transferase n=1 Tax=Elysia marginata TaxID=1093978 RepID=A0AAV4HTH2_9GAST|nr:E3 ubiquitin-protein ligase RFWD3-like [Elysia marginata]